MGDARVIAAVSAVLSWLVTNWWVLVVLRACAAVGGLWWFHRFQQQQAWERVQQQPALRYALPQLDALHHRAFEYAIRDLMRRDGCADARQIGGAGDNGADVLATDPTGRSRVIQCSTERPVTAGRRSAPRACGESTGPPVSSTARTSSSSSRTSGSPRVAHPWTLS
ncbi:restriction endonuclease [Streptomyces microflavus]|uniref:restriction endonuclease n=1 Tax=Streptomyces microflavus TaxID=1919 RepID=UPI002E30896F|nr:restriction endonuclease [Streptomyces microflavus]